MGVRGYPTSRRGHGPVGWCCFSLFLWCMICFRLLMTFFCILVRYEMYVKLLCGSLVRDRGFVTS